jgi:lysophospholipase L1-like esterase
VLLAAPVLLLATASCSSEHGSAAIAPYGTDSTVAVPPTVPPASAAAAADAGATIAVQRLAMVGDSITQGAQQNLEAAFGSLGLDDVTINAEQGRRMTASNSITSGVDGIKKVLAKGAPPDLWVIALGSNDVANYLPQDYAAAINEVLAAIPPGAPVLWVDCYLERYPDLSKQFDTALRQVLTARGNARVVDWATVAAEDGVLRDGIHPSGFGVDEFTRRVSSAVSDWTS